MKTVLNVAVVLAAAATPCVHVLAAEPGRQIPARVLPVPDTVSPEEHALIAAPFPPFWNVHPKSSDEWKEFVTKADAPVIGGIPGLLAKLNVKREQGEIAGVKIYVMT